MDKEKDAPSGPFCWSLVGTLLIKETYLLLVLFLNFSIFPIDEIFFEILTYLKLKIRRGKMGIWHYILKFF